MNKLEYAKLLKSSKWKAKRAEIIIRDNYKCTRCGQTKGLQVHHVHYIEGRLPWQYPNYFLITVCRDCHKYYHDRNGTSILPAKEKRPPQQKRKSMPKRKRRGWSFKRMEDALKWQKKVNKKYANVTF